MKIKKIIKKFQIDNYVTIIGEKNREEVLKIMRKHDIFALVSKQETLGLVYLEAMSQGCITIGSKNEGIDGIIINGENGFLCKSGNVVDLANKLEEIYYSDKQKLEQLSKNALQTIKNLTQKKVAIEYLHYLEEVKKTYIRNNIKLGESR